ncbi:MAG: hypothetical protein LBL62_05095 [Planctomycetaceae bacterium]|jgi:N-acetylmuramic acid 6-phosphate etherase|nr:hypothetical protein [Planctomycetaceae bacterium]
MTKPSYQQDAEHFLLHETQFHLGMMLTEQPHPKTRGLSDKLAEDMVAGLAMLLSVDDDLPPVAKKTLDSIPFQKLRNDIFATLESGNRIFFSGCGATGRLAILLDAAHRKFCAKNSQCFPEHRKYFETLSEQTFSVMTGGDFALIRSVESFEDYIVFGKRQLFDAGIKAGDCLIAVSEGGETSSVIGTIHAALEAGLQTHFLFNNPSDLLVQKIERSRTVIEDSRVNIVNLTTGAMAIAGSTRMQATTIEMLIIGLAFESALAEHLRKTLPPNIVQKMGNFPQTPFEGLERFECLLRQLQRQDNLKTLAEITDFEYSIYHAHGLITYFSDEYSIDIFTDTTERSPTFKIPPFRSILEKEAPASWAFVKDPLRTTPEAWKHLLGRVPCCLAWKPDDYRNMNVAENIIANPPEIGIDILSAYKIGNEKDSSRFAVSPNAAVAFLVGQNEVGHLAGTDQWFQTFWNTGKCFEKQAALAIGSNRPDSVTALWNGGLFFIETDLPESPLDLFSHLAAKLVLNNISTATMGKLGRLTSNWMAHVDATNKKLIDRSIRLVAELTGLSYNISCLAIFKTLHEIRSWSEDRRKTVSPVAYTIEQIKKGDYHTITDAHKLPPTLYIEN